MEKTNYEKILAQFDEALKEEIQDKCLYAVLDAAFQQGYAEGQRDALTKSNERGNYAALMDKFLDAADDTEHGNKPLASCMGDLYNYFTEHPLEDKNENA